MRTGIGASRTDLRGYNGYALESFINSFRFQTEIDEAEQLTFYSVKRRFSAIIIKGDHYRRSPILYIYTVFMNHQ